MDENKKLLIAAVVLILSIIIYFRRTMRVFEQQHGQERANVIWGVFADVIFLMLPFVVYVIVSAWKNNLTYSFSLPELSIAASIFGGQGILNYFRAVVGITAIRANVERSLFLLVTGISIFLIGIVFATLSIFTETTPWWFPWAQIILLTFALPIYSALTAGGRFIELQQITSQQSGG